MGVDRDTLAETARALAHPVRIRLLELLAAQRECRGSEIFSEIPLAQSTISEHLSVLKRARLVDSHPTGTAMVYCINTRALEPLAELLGTLCTTSPACDTTQGASDE